MDISSVQPAQQLRPEVETTSANPSAASIRLADSEWKIINLDEHINANVNKRANDYLDMLNGWRAAEQHEAGAKSRHVRAPSRSALMDFTEVRHQDANVAKNTLNQILKCVQDDLKELRQLRKDTFDYVNHGSGGYGKLKAGKTAHDRDHYLEKLTEHYQIVRMIEAAEKNQEKNMAWFKLARLDDLFGDLRALEEGRAVPDFSFHLDLLQELD